MLCCGCVVYSVGPNGKDDGGKGIADRVEHNEDWDDVAIRMPGPTTPGPR